MSDPVPLSEFERSILDFELRWSHTDGNKRRAVEAKFGVHSATYYRWRSALIERPEALAYAPALVRRLRGRPSGT